MWGRTRHSGWCSCGIRRPERSTSTQHQPFSVISLSRI
jgi:hypothetical protein